MAKKQANLQGKHDLGHRPFAHVILIWTARVASPEFVSAPGNRLCRSNGRAADYNRQDVSSILTSGSNSRFQIRPMGNHATPLTAVTNVVRHARAKSRNPEQSHDAQSGKSCMIRLKFCTIDVRDGAIWSTFPDGSTSTNWPHPDDASYVQVARECGFTDIMRYCLAHEVCHAAVPEMLFDRPSYVVSMAAQNRKQNLAAAMAEERLVWLLQRAATGAIPVVDVQWFAVIDRLKQLDLCGASMPEQLPVWWNSSRSF
jgi:hypothetical protein